MKKISKIAAILVLITLAAVSIGAKLRPAHIVTEEREEVIAELIRSGSVNVAVMDKIYHAKIEASGSASKWTKRMTAAHEIADAARDIGVSNDDPIINGLSAIWWNDYNDLRMVAKTISREAPYCPYWHQVAVGAVIMNRVADPRFPNTVYDVLMQPKQYSPSYTYNFTGISDQHYRAAIDAMDGNHDVPANVVWQAEFFQGRGIWKTSAVNTGYWSSVTYFCY